MTTLNTDNQTQIDIEGRLNPLLALPNNKVLAQAMMNLFVADIANHTADTIDVQVQNQWGDAEEFAAFAPINDNSFWAVSIDDVHQVTIDDLTLTSEKKFPLPGSDAFAMMIKASSSNDGSLAVVDGGHLMTIVNGDAKHIATEKDQFWQVAFSPDGNQIAVSYENGAIEIRDGKSLELVEALEPMGALALSLVFSPDSSRLAVGDDRQAVRVYERDGEFTDYEHYAKATNINWTSDNNTILVTGLTRMVTVFDIGNPEATAQEMFDFGTRYFQDSTFDGETLVVSVEDVGLIAIPVEP